MNDMSQPPPPPQANPPAPPPSGQGPPAKPTPAARPKRKTPPAVIIGIMLAGAAIAAALWMLTRILVPTGPVVNLDRQPVVLPRPGPAPGPVEQPVRSSPPAQSLPTSGPVLASPHFQAITAGRAVVRTLHQPPATLVTQPAPLAEPAQTKQAWRLTPVQLIAAGEIESAKVMGSNGYPLLVAQSGPQTQLLVLTVQVAPARPVFAIDLTGLALLEDSGAVHRPVGLALSPAAPRVTSSAASPAPAPATAASGQPTAASAPAEATTSASPARPARLPEFRDHSIGLALYVQDDKLFSSLLQNLGPGMVATWAPAGWDRPVKLDLLFDITLPAKELVLSGTAGL